MVRRDGSCECQNWLADQQEKRFYPRESNHRRGACHPPQKARAGRSQICFSAYAGPKDYVGLSELKYEQRRSCSSVCFGGCRTFELAAQQTAIHPGQLWFGHHCPHDSGQALALASDSQGHPFAKENAGSSGSHGQTQGKIQGEPAKTESGDDEVLQGEQGQSFCGLLAHPHPNPHFPKHVLDVALAAELYGQGFLWANDLSEQDSVSVLQGFSDQLVADPDGSDPVVSMKLNPIQMGPEMSEAQRINAK